ncbi:UBX domain-containing protein 11 isoform 2-T2 [Discoglossus pictus]
MSSPLISLSKPRRAGIATGGHTPGVTPRNLIQAALITPEGQLMSRHKTPSEPPESGRRAAPFKSLAGYTEELLLLSLPSNAMRSSVKGTPSILGQSAQGPVPSDFDLLSSTMRRVGELEKKVRLQDREIQHKDQEIAALGEKIKKLQRHKREGSPSGSKAQELEKRCNELQKKVWDMEHFLSDYGLVWVGDNNESSDVEQNTGRQNPGPGTSGSFHLDFDLVLENLRDLNVLGGEGESQIEYRDGGARLRTPEPIPLTLYNNGIIMFKGPFRSYQEPSTQQCLRDIMDGFFPSELQSRFPDGVTFQVTDKRNVFFQERQLWDEFPGPGQTVGGTEGKIQKNREMPGPKLKMEQFLNKLPKSVVRRGQVLDIREPIRETLQGDGINKSPQEILVESPNVLAMEDRSENQMAVSNLRIRSESGDQTYKVRMLPTETLGDLRTYLCKFRSPNLSSYDIIGRFPHCVYDDDSRPLQEIGLVPNAFLILRARTVEGQVPASALQKD